MAKSRARKLADIIVGAGIDIDGNLTFDGGSTSADLTFADGDKANFGDASDLQIYHDGSASYIKEAGTGDFIIQGSNTLRLQGSSSQELANFGTGGAVTLFHNNSAKFATSSTGATITGTLVADGLTMGDNELIQLGAGNDLRLYHDGSHSRILENGTGNLIIQGTNLDLADTATGENFLRAVSNSSVEIYYDGSKKFETTSGGVTVTGGLVATSTSQFTDINIPDNNAARFGSSQDLQIFHNGSHSFIKDAGTGDLYIGASNNIALMNAAFSENKLLATTDGALTLYYDGSAKLATFSGGVSVTGQLNATTMHLPDGSTGLQLGASNDTKFFHDGSNSKITHSGSGGFYIGADTLGLQTGAHNENYLTAAANGAVSLYYDNSVKLATTSTGIQVTGNIDFPSSATILGGGTNTDMTIGTSSSGYQGLLKLQSTGDIQLFQYGSSWTTNVTFKGDGQVGIGTTSPQSFVESSRLVVGSGTSGLNEMMFLYSGTDAFGAIGFADGTSGTAAYRGIVGYHHEDDELFFSTNGGGEANRDVTITSAGNVGIGTETPTGAKLHVAGGIKGTDLIAHDSTGLALQTDEGTKRLVVLDSGTVVVGATVTDSSASMGGQSPIFFANGYTSLGGLRINGADGGNTLYRSGGDIAITSASNNVQLKAPSGAIIADDRFQPNEHIIFGSSTGYLQFPGTGGRAWAMASSGGTAAPGTQAATFGIHHWNGSAWSNPVNISSSGKLGVGTSNPVARGLDVLTNSTNTFTPSNDSWHSLVVRNDAAAATNCVGLAFNVSGGYHQNAGTGIAAVKNGTNSDHGAHLVFITRPQNAVAEERMRITDAGQVGIGETNPNQDAAVEISKAAPNTGVTTLRLTNSVNNKGQRIDFEDDNASRCFTLSHDNGSNITYMGNLVNEPFSFYTNGNERMRITDAGKVFIGISSASDAQFRVNQTTTDQWAANFINHQNVAYGLSIDTSGSANTGAYNFAAYTPSGTGVFITNTTKVGIGQTSPTSTLDLTNTSDTAERAIRIENSSARLYVGVEGSSGNRFVGSSTDNAFIGTTTSDGLELATANTVRATIDTSGVISTPYTEFLGFEDAINILNADPENGGTDFDQTPTNDADGGGTTWEISDNGDAIYFSSTSGGHGGTWMKVYCDGGLWAIKGSVRLTNTDGAVHGSTSSANYKFTHSFRFYIDSGPDSGVLKWDADTAASTTGTDFTRAAFAGAPVSMSGGYKTIKYQTNGYNGVQRIYITDLQLVKVG